MKTQKEIINDLKIYRKVYLDSAKQERKKYYLEERKFYRDMNFNDFLEYRSKLNLLEKIL